MRATISIIALSALFAAGAAQADVIGATFGAGGWSQDPGGWVQYETDDEFDVDDDLGLDEETGGYAYARFEHPVPLLPNVRLHYQQASFEGTGRIQETITFGDVSFRTNDEVKSEANLDYIDGTLYYEVLDNVVSADLGLNIRYMTGDVEVTRISTGETEKVDLNVAFPMGYAMLRADIPTTGLFLKAEGAFIGYDGNRIADVMLGGGYELDLMAASIGLEAGYKSLQVKLNDVEDADADVSVQGPYAGVVVDF